MSKVKDDLARSGLVLEDLNARIVTPSELAAVGLEASGFGEDGYVIPYYSLTGQAMKYYRVRLVGAAEEFAGVKYKQAGASQNHVYFPPKFGEVVQEMHRGWRGRYLSLERPCVLIVEGEKKAVAATKLGVPTVAIGGVYSWKNRNIILPKGTTFKTVGTTVHARLPSGEVGERASLGVDEGGPAAVGLGDLIALCVTNDWDIIICFDTDGFQVKTDVQRAAARLGYELRHRGVRTTRIRQMILPGKMNSKVGLDDYIMAEGEGAFRNLVIKTQRKGIAFPRHPTPREHVTAQLQGKTGRKVLQNTALTILTELENRGKRLRTIGSDELHFFDNKTHKLMRVVLGSQREPLHETPFGALLYREFNIGADDGKLINWLASQYTGEPGVEDVTTHKVVTHLGEHGMTDSIAVQISDSQFAVVTPDPNHPFQIYHNGSMGVMFEQGMVEPVDPYKLEAEFYRFHDMDMKDQMHWFDVIAEMDFKPPEFDGTSRPKADSKQSRAIASLLYYMSPFLLRWRGTQLPVELVIGSPGSGKSSLCSLRQFVLTGRTTLINITDDIKDWYATIASHGGMIILDNVNFTADIKSYGQRMSDELCRLVTEPDPHVEMRKLYSTHGLARIRAHNTFILTSIGQPFVKADLVQRAAIFELEQLRESHESNWMQRQLDRCGGRVGWLGHELAVLHKFLHKVTQEGTWNNNYAAEHRLTHYEQILRVMGKLFGLDPEWITDALTIVNSADEYGAVNDEMIESVLQGLEKFAEYMRLKYPDDYAGREVTTGDIARWAKSSEKMSKHFTLVNPRKLGRFMVKHENTLRTRVRLIPRGKINNRMHYLVYPPDTPIPQKRGDS